MLAQGCHAWPPRCKSMPGSAGRLQAPYVSSMTALSVWLDERSDLLDTSLSTACQQIASQVVGEMRAAPQWRLCPRLPVPKNRANGLCGRRQITKGATDRRFFGCSAPLSYAGLHPCRYLMLKVT